MIAGMWWLKRQPEKFLREQLTDARDALTNQIAILEAGPLKPEPGEWAQMRAQATDLHVMLGDVESQLAELEPHDD